METPNGTLEAQAGPKTEEPTYVLPSLDKGPASFFDTESKSFWLGLPLDRIDILDALAVVDGAKLEIIQRWKNAAIQRANASKIVKPHWSENAKKLGKALIQKLH